MTGPAPAGRAPAGGHPATTDGSLTLEFALAVPLLFLAAVVVLAAGVVGRDALVAQDAARTAARVAATTTDHAAVHAAVDEALGERWFTVSVVPRVRQPGDLVRVTVTIRTTGPAARPLTAQAVAVTEPGVGP